MERNTWNTFVERIVPGIHYYPERKCVAEGCDNQAEHGMLLFRTDPLYHRFVLCNSCWDTAETSILNISIIRLIEAVDERPGEFKLVHYSSGYKRNGEKNIPSELQIRNSYGIIDRILISYVNERIECPYCKGTGQAENKENKAAGSGYQTTNPADDSSDSTPYYQNHE